MITTIGLLGSLAMLGGLIFGDFRLGLLGLLACLSAALFEGWIDHRRRRRKALLRAQVRRNALNSWR